MRINESYWDKLFSSQIEDWLDFAWSNRKNTKYRSYQGERRRVEGSNSPLGNNRSRQTKTGLKTAINTHDLYNDWKVNAGKVCLVHYENAVNEMHLFFDYMKDSGFEVF